MNKISVDVVGSCTVRDAFEISPLLKENFSVNKFIQNNSPLTLDDTSLEANGIHITKDDFKNTHNCWYKWFDLNANNKFKNYLSQNRSEYLIINLIEIFYNFYELEVNNLKIRICNQYGITKNNIISKFPVYKTINPLELDFTEVEEYLKRYANFLKGLYNENKIIFLKNYPAKFYIRKGDGKLHPFNDLDFNRIIIFLNRTYSFFLSLFDNINVISLPLNTLGDEQHKWGLSPQHYVNEAYIYIGKQIFYIIINGVKGNCRSVVNYIEFESFNDSIINKMTYFDNDTPFYEFCMRYSYVRVLVVSQKVENKTFTISNLNNAKLSSPEWIKKIGFGYMILSNKGTLSFEINLLLNMNFKIYLQTIDARSCNGRKYDIHVEITKFCLDENVIIDKEKKVTVSHDKPFVFSYNSLSKCNFKILINYNPLNYI